jgi:FkbM family methyltransferase
VESQTVREPAPVTWRKVVVRGLSRLPAPVATSIWRTRRVLARAQRRRLEAAGDYSRSSPALGCLDEALARYLDYPGGFFVEAGAYDGYDQSNTYRLERVLGWRGVLVEPIRYLAREAARERPRSRVFNCALVDADSDGEPVSLLYGGLLTTVAGARGIPSDDHEWVAAAHAVAQEQPAHEFRTTGRALSSILDEVEAPEIDFMSLDVEGFEVSVLRGLDFERHAPRWLLVEARSGATAQSDIESVLGHRYELAEAVSPYDLLYRRLS